MKIGFFTDSHFSSAEVTCENRYNSASLRKIEEAFQVFLAEQCDLVICLGDLIDREQEHAKEIANLEQISMILSGYPFKTYVLMGNHDAFAFEQTEFYSILGEQHRPVNLSANGLNLIFLDTCYFISGLHYQPGDSDWTDTFLPDVDQLEELLAGLTGDTYLFLHQNIDPTIRSDHRLFNDREIRDILEHNRHVKGVFQGHYHPGKVSEVNDIRYVTYPAMCEQEKAYWVLELV